MITYVSMIVVVLVTVVIVHGTVGVTVESSHQVTSSATSNVAIVSWSCSHHMLQYGPWLAPKPSCS